MGVWGQGHQFRERALPCPQLYPLEGGCLAREVGRVWRVCHLAAVGLGLQQEHLSLWEPSPQPRCLAQLQKEPLML